MSSELGDFAPLREEYPNPRNSPLEKFAQAAQTVSYSNVKGAKKNRLCRGDRLVALLCRAAQ